MSTTVRGEGRRGRDLQDLHPGDDLLGPGLGEGDSPGGGGGGRGDCLVGMAVVRGGLVARRLQSGLSVEDRPGHL